MVDLSTVIAYAVASCLVFSHGVHALANLTDPNWPYQSYQTTDFHPPELSITKPGATADGYLFIGTFGSAPVEKAAMIMTDDNELVWQGTWGLVAPSNVGVYEYQGKPVLAYYNGTVVPEPVGRGYGEVYLFDQSYEQIAEVTLPGTFLTLVPNQTFPSNIDLHELYITKNNTLLVTANNVTQYDLSSVGGPTDGWIVDCLVYEIDIATNDILFRWSSLEHIADLPLNLSLYPLGSEGYSGTNQSTAWGYFHINSVSTFGDGYIISSRYFCMGIAIDAQGDVQWRLQGRTGVDFTLGPSTNFCYQHDIRLESGDPSTNFTLSMHNNFNAPLDYGNNPSSGLLLDVSMTSRSVTLNRKLINQANPVFAPAQGSYQPLANNHVLVDHGYLPVFEEYAGDNSVAMTVTFGPYNNTSPSGGGKTLSYRAFRQPWVGCPKTKPAISTSTVDSGSGISVYMSWNGATEYDAWNVYSGASPSSLSLTTHVKRNGRFESIAVLPKQTVVNGTSVASTKYVQVEALLPQGCCIGLNNTRSDVVAVNGTSNGTSTN